MKFRISIDDSTNLGRVLASLPVRNRQARLIELATFGLIASETSNASRGFSELSPVRSNEHITDYATATATASTKATAPTSVAPIAPPASNMAGEEIIDFGDLQNI